MDEKTAVLELGNAIGFGNLMNLASEAWQKQLELHDYPKTGAFTCITIAELSNLKAERDRLMDGIAYTVDILAEIQPRRILMAQHKRTLIMAEKYLIALWKFAKAIESEE